MGGKPSAGRARQATPEPIKTSTWGSAREPVSTPQAAPTGGDGVPSLSASAQDPSLSQADSLDPEVARRLDERLRDRFGRERGSG